MKKYFKKFDSEITVIPNGLEKHLSFVYGKHLVFIDSMEFMNSFFIRQFFKNLSGDNFKYLSQEFSEELVELLKQKGFYFYVIQKVGLVMKNPAIR